MRPARVDAWLRWSRACVVASVALATAVVAHVSAGGALPSAPWLLVLLSVVAAVSARFLRHPARTSTIVALVAGGQFAGHFALTALAGHGGGHAPAPALPRPDRTPDLLAGSDATGARRGNLYDLTMGSPAPSPGDGAAAPGIPHWMSHIVADLTGPNALMALAHLAAAALLGWWLARGEHALWSLVCLTGTEAAALRARLRDAGRRAGLPVCSVLAAVATRLDLADATYDVRERAGGDLRWHLDALARVMGRRGPPVPAA